MFCQPDSRLADAVVAETSRAVLVDTNIIRSPSHSAPSAYARRICYLALRQAGWTYAAIADYFARDHTTILASVRQASDETQTLAARILDQSLASSRIEPATRFEFARRDLERLAEIIADDPNWGLPKNQGGYGGVAARIARHIHDRLTAS